MIIFVSFLLEMITSTVCNKVDFFYRKMCAARGHIFSHSLHLLLQEPDIPLDIPLDITCSVCLDMFYRPHRCEPCGHMFCEHCLRQLSRQTPTFTPCPLCREVISKCVLNTGMYT